MPSCREPSLALALGGSAKQVRRPDPERDPGPPCPIATSTLRRRRLQPDPCLADARVSRRQWPLRLRMRNRLRLRPPSRKRSASRRQPRCCDPRPTSGVADASNRIPVLPTLECPVGTGRHGFGFGNGFGHRHGNGAHRGASRDAATPGDRAIADSFSKRVTERPRSDGLCEAIGGRTLAYYIFIQAHERPCSFVGKSNMKGSDPLAAVPHPRGSPTGSRTGSGAEPRE